MFEKRQATYKKSWYSSRLPVEDACGIFLQITAIHIQRPKIKLVKRKDKVKSTQGGVSDIDTTFIPFQNNF